VCKIERCLALFFSPYLAEGGAMLSYLSNINESDFLNVIF